MSLVKNKSEEISSGTLDHFLTVLNLGTSCLCSLYYNGESIDYRSKRGGV